MATINPPKEAARTARSRITHGPTRRGGKSQGKAKATRGLARNAVIPGASPAPQRRSRRAPRIDTVFHLTGRFTRQHGLFITVRLGVPALIAIGSLVPSVATLLHWFGII